jgi:Mg2+ and Co2+ transporter CorA
MIEKTISEIEAKVSGAEAVSGDHKRELLELLGKLKAEVSTLSQTHSEQADSIANFAKLSAHEATRTAPNAQLREISNQGLLSSVEGFEQSHPKLVQVVSNISKTLSDLGI